MGKQETKFGEWLRETLDEHGITSSRQAMVRTDIAYTTIENILRGTKPNADTVVRIARAFKGDVETCLRLAGYIEMAEAWAERGEAGGRDQEHGRGEELTYEEVEDERELISYYRGTPNDLKPIALAQLKALRDAKRAQEPTIGKRVKDE